MDEVKNNAGVATRPYKGAMHVHSTYSDGEFTLAELREVFRAEGCSFVCMADHADAFDAAKAARYVDECRALSAEDFCFLPGLEFGCLDRMHIAGFGVTALIESDQPPEVIEHIRRHGGVSVLAHPQDRLFDRIEAFEVLPDGIEVWNSKYDGRYAPRPGTFALLGRLRRRAPGLGAFYGQDLHFRRQFRGLYTEVALPSLGPDTLLAAISGGRYHGVHGEEVLPADGCLDPELLRRFEVVHRRSDRLRGVFKVAKGVMDRFGARVPQPLKAQLRRLF